MTGYVATDMAKSMTKMFCHKYDDVASHMMCPKICDKKIHHKLCGGGS
jgi:hypothetical protein